MLFQNLVPIPDPGATCTTTPTITSTVAAGQQRGITSKCKSAQIAIANSFFSCNIFLFVLVDKTSLNREVEVDVLHKSQAILCC